MKKKLFIFFIIFFMPFFYNVLAEDYILYDGQQGTTTNAHNLTNAPVPLNDDDSFTVNSNAEISVNVNNDSIAKGIAGSNNNTITNDGRVDSYVEISNISRKLYSYGIFTNDNNNIINNGYINSSGLNYKEDSSVYGIFMNNANAVENNGSITVSATTLDSIHRRIARARGISNAFGGISRINNSRIINNGTISVSTRNDYWGEVWSVGIEVGNNNTIINNGSLSISYYIDRGRGWGGGLDVDGSNNYIVNNGSIVSSGYSTFFSENRGIDIDGSNNTAINNGTIDISSSSVSGTSYSYGIDCMGAFSHNTITNKGSIKSYSSSKESFAYSYGVYFLRSKNNISNSGSIITIASSNKKDAYSYGIYIFPGANNTNINNSGSIISTANSSNQTSYSYGIYILSDNNIITNSGYIEAIGKQAYGIFIDGTGNTLNIKNTSTIKGSTASLGFDTGVTTVNLEKGGSYYLTYDGIDPNINAPGQLIVHKTDGVFNDGRVTGLIATITPDSLPTGGIESNITSIGRDAHIVLFNRMRAGGNSIWLNNFSNFTKKDITKGHDYGIIMGADKKFGLLKRLGFFVGYNWGEQRNDKSRWKINSSGYLLGLYAEAKFNKFNPGFVFSYSNSHLEYEEFVGGIGKTESHSSSWYLYPEISLGYDIGKIMWFNIKPVLYLGYLYLKTDDYNNNVNLKIDDRRTGFLISRLEINFNHENKKKNSYIIPRIGLENVNRVTGDDKVDIVLAGVKFNNVSINNKDDAEETFGYIGCNLNTYITKKIKFYGDMEFAFGGENDKKNINLTGGVIISF